MSGVANTHLGFPGIRWELGTPYQFATTTKSPVRVDNDGLIYYFGSAVKIPLVTKDSERALVPKATGSTMQRPPEGMANPWKFILNPNNNCGDEIIKNVYDTILYYQDGFVKAGAAPDQWFQVASKYELDESGEPTNVLDRYRILNSLFYQSTNQGKIGFLGSKMPMAPVSVSTLRKDLRLLKRRTKAFSLAIETDYVQQAWTTKVESQYGSRTFVVLSTLDGKFHTFPINAPLDNNGQIAAKYIKTVTPAYPDWVFPFTNIKAAVATRGTLPMVPIITWSIRSDGQRAITCLVERQPFANNLLDQVLLANGSYPEYRSEQFDLGPAKVFAEKTYYGSGDSEPLMIDRLGMVELDFDFSINTPELESYSFYATVVNQESPTDTSPMRIGIAYAHPALAKKGIVVDSKIELFMQFYRSQDQLKFHRALDGLYGSEVPQYGRWIVTVNGSERLKFPMQAMLDENLDPIPFLCMKHWLNTTTIYTELENLDLSSLSFYRTIRIRQPILERNKPRTSSGGWLGTMNHLKKKCAIQTDAFVFGEVVETKQCGNADLFEHFVTYLSFHFDSNLRASLTEWQPSVVHPLRANYRTFFTKPSTGSGFLGQGRLPPQWWGHVLFWPMWYVFAEMVHKEVAGEFVKGERHDWTHEEHTAYLNTKYPSGSDPPFPGGLIQYYSDPPEGSVYEDDGYHLGCKHGCNSAYPRISEVTANNFEQYWSYVLDFANTQTDISSIFGLTTLIANGFGSHTYGSWPIDGMLRTANPEWDGDSVVMSWLAKEVFVLLKAIFPMEHGSYGFGNVLNTTNNMVFASPQYNLSALEYILGLCFAYHHAADGQFSNSTDAFWMLDSGHGHTFEDHFVLRDYPWAWHFAIQNYNRLWVNRGRNKIMVHPNGHYSLMHDYVYCPTGIEPEGELWAYTLSSNATNHPDNPISDYRTGFMHTDVPATSERDGFMMDKLSFWYDQHDNNARRDAQSSL
jgi:hypothetical protein